MTEEYDVKKVDRALYSQLLVFAAWDTNGFEIKVQNYIEAVRINPNCIDGLNCLMEYISFSECQYITALKSLASKAKALLPKYYFKEIIGSFYGFLDTRPYMRVLENLMVELFEVEQLSEARKIAEKMLHLNPNDNQGVRFYLYSIYLEQKYYLGIRQLYKEYGENDSFFKWGKCLELLLLNNKSKADELYGEAIILNHHFLEYLAKQKIPNDNGDPYMSDGDENEAQFIYKLQRRAWEKDEKILKYVIETYC